MMNKGRETYLSEMNMRLIREREILNAERENQQIKKILWKMGFVVSFGINIGMWL